MSHYPGELSYLHAFLYIIEGIVDEEDTDSNVYNKILKLANIYNKQQGQEQESGIIPENEIPSQGEMTNDIQNNNNLEEETETVQS